LTDCFIFWVKLLDVELHPCRHLFIELVDKPYLDVRYWYYYFSWVNFQEPMGLYSMNRLGLGFESSFLVNSPILVVRLKVFIDGLTDSFAPFSSSKETLPQFAPCAAQSCTIVHANQGADVFQIATYRLLKLETDFR
jgi:hypothetical protein